MAFAYYRRLNKKQRRIYDRSDEFSAIRLQRPARLRPLVHHLHSALASGDRAEVGATSRNLATGARHRAVSRQPP